MPRSLIIAAALIATATAAGAQSQSAVDLRQLYLSAENAFKAHEFDNSKTLFQRVLAESVRERRQSEAATDREQLTKIIANAHDRLGLITVQRQQFEEAFHQFVEVKKAQPDFPRIDFNIGLAAIHADRIADAIDALNHTVQRSPSDMQARTLLGQAQFEHGDFAAALANLEAAHADESADPVLLLAIGTCFSRTGQIDKAQAVFKRLIETQSGKPEVHMFLGQSAYAQGKAEVAKAELQNALEINPYAPEAHYYLGIIALDADDFASAEREFHAEVTIHPEEAKAVVAEADVILRDGKRQQAIRLLRKITATHPGYARAHYLLGRALSNENQWEQAAAELEVATREDPTASYSHYVLGRVYLHLGRTTDGKRELELSQRLSNANRANANRNGSKN
jgi:tetratricopeptide (TPR) repeat protein